MDPLSITASVAGIASAAGVVYQSIAKYIHDVRDAPREVDSLAAETRNLFGILNNLSLLVSTLEKDRVYAVLKDSHLDALRHTMYTMQLKLDRASEDLHRGSKRDAVLRRLRWPFSRSETKELLEEMTRHKDNLGLALAADSMERLLELLRAQNKTQQSMATLSKGIQNLTMALDARREIEIRTTLDAKRREVVSFFQAVNPQHKLEACVDLRQDMTGLWLLNSPSYQSWTEQPGQKVWLSGIPGSGKTILCGAIIQDVLQRSTLSTAVAFFFCDYAVTSSHKPTQVLGSLAVQLALQSADAFAVLEDYYDELHPPTGLAKPVRLADMQATMASLLLCFDRVFVVVDALDECKPDDVGVAQALRDMARGSLNVNMALLSRDEEPIHDVLEDDFQNIEIAAHVEDLTLYIDAQMAVRKVFSSMLLRQPALYHDIRASLLKNAQGMFRWVACQLDYLEKLPSNGQRRKALDKLPGTLSQTYQRILENANENSDKASRDLVRRALHWIAISSPPLTISQLCEAVSLRDDCDDLDDEDIIDESEIARACSSLIRKTRDGTRFEFAHFTVREFLTGIAPESKLADLRLDPRAAERSLALAALRFLLIPRFGMPLLQGEDAKLHDHGRALLDSFHTYAAVHWMGYAKDHMTDPEVLSLAGRLFDAAKAPQFLRFAFAVVAYILGPRLGEAGTQVVNIRAPDFTPLHLAASLGIPELCAFLVKEQDLDVDSLSPEVGSSLDAALAGLWVLSLRTAHPFRTISGSQKRETVEFLVDQSACCTLRYERDYTNETKRNGPLALFEELGDAVLCTKILANATTDSQFIHGFQEDLLAAYSARPFAAKLAGAICGYADSHLDASRRFLDLSEAIRAFESRAQMPPAEDQRLSSLAASSAAASRSGLLQAMEANSTKALKTLLETQFRACCEARFENGQGLLHVAASGRRLPAVKTMLAAGFPLDLADDEGETALHKCYRDDCAMVARHLLNQGANALATNKDGKTLWHLAAEAGSLAVLDGLISSGCDVRLALGTPDGQGRTPIASAMLCRSLASAQFLVEHCGCLGAYFQSPAPLVSAIYEPGGLPFLQALEKQNGIRACLFREGDPPPLIHASLDTDVQIIQILRPYTDIEELFNGKTAAQHAIENFLAFPTRQLEANPDAFGALLTPRLMHEACFDGRTLWEFACLYPLEHVIGAIPRLTKSWYFDQERANLLKAQFKAYSTVLMSILSAGQSFADRNRVNLVAALLPLLSLMENMNWLGGKSVHLKPLAEYCSERVMKSPNSRYSACLGLQELRGAYREDILLDFRFVIACVCVERDENNKAASLSHLLSMDLPEKAYVELAPKISIFDLAACTIDTFRRICQSLATADHRLGGYKRLSFVFWEPEYVFFRYNRPNQWHPCPAVPWPKTEDDATFAWTQTMTITFHTDSASAPQPVAQQFRGCNFVHAAALVGMTFLVDFFLQNKVFDVNVLSGDGCTPLVFAALGRHANTAKYLVSHGANPLLRSKTGLELQTFVTKGSDVWCALFPNSGPPDPKQVATDAFRYTINEASYASVPEPVQPAEADC